jgi:hypothetical protein
LAADEKEKETEPAFPRTLFPSGDSCRIFSFFFSSVFRVFIGETTTCFGSIRNIPLLLLLVDNKDLLLLITIEA